ncbi:DnaD domain protein [Lactobacillus sp. PV034]|uniref:DnaD domain protein n=1 Tax=Lactobacillus sp. PV034 TaxID=2594495 RepID=UPI0022408B67|nr:DnaD domain protein [Lactobacillus sp. PV034]QNQ80124.1 replication initiation/membrane attachment protein [Lactobacillus sp. PV034]
MYVSSNPKQPFYVANQIVLTSNDQKVLTKLYQPLVGVLGVGLYTTLVNEFDTIPFAGDYKTLYQLQDQTDADLKSIFSSLHHLEAVGLLKTFVGQNPVLGDVIIFQLLPVPRPQEFFATFLLSSMLRERLGTVGFERLVKEFTPRVFTGLKDAREVSAGFFEVFHLSQNAAIEPPAVVKEASAKVGEVKAPQVKLTEKAKKIDWDFLLALFDAYHINKAEVDKHRSEISQLMAFYDLSEQDFINEAMLTFSAGKTSLDMEAIASVIAENYGSRQTKTSVEKQITPKKDTLATIKNLSKQDDEFLKEVNQYSVVDYLYHLKEKKGGYVTANEKKVLYRLQNQYGLSPQLINVLIYTCLEYDSVLAPNLADRIANDWLQKGVTTAVQAIGYVKKRRSQTRNRRYQVNHKPVKKTSDWQAKKRQTSETSRAQMSEDEMNQIFKNFGKENKG